MIKAATRYQYVVSFCSADDSQVTWNVSIFHNEDKKTINILIIHKIIEKITQLSQFCDDCMMLLLYCYSTHIICTCIVIWSNEWVSNKKLAVTKTNTHLISCWRHVMPIARFSHHFAASFEFISSESAWLALQSQKMTSPNNAYIHRRGYISNCKRQRFKFTFVCFDFGTILSLHALIVFDSKSHLIWISSNLIFLNIKLECPKWESSWKRMLSNNVFVHAFPYCCHYSKFEFKFDFCRPITW